MTSSFTVNSGFGLSSNCSRIMSSEKVNDVTPMITGTHQNEIQCNAKIDKATGLKSDMITSFR